MKNRRWREVGVLAVILVAAALVSQTTYVLRHGELHYHTADACVSRWSVPALYWKSHPSQEGASRCLVNLESIANALNLYGHFHHGALPRTLVEPGVPTVSTCPHSERLYVYQSAGDAFTVVCSGDWHNAVGYRRDFPQYTSSDGPRIR